MTQIVVISTTSLVTFAAIMLFYHHHIRGRVTSQKRKSLILGVMLGAGASLLMLQPIELTPDVDFNNRPMFVGFAGFLGGWIAAVAALFLTSATLMAIAGPNVSTGLLVLSVAACLGVFGHIFLNKTRLRPPWSWTVLGGLLSLFVALFWIMVMPDQARVPMLRNTVVILAIIGVIGGAVGAGYLHSGVFDVVEQRQLAIAQSRKDELTGTFNRRGLNIEYHAIVFRSAETGVAVLAIDIDHFKLVNDSFGHAVGDRLLKLIADQLHKIVRKDDIIARMGGDEFIVVLTNTTQEEAENTAERLCHSINEIPMNLEADNMLKAAHEMVSMSIGVAFTRSPPKRLDALLEASDQLLYDAKRNGRGRVAAAEVIPLDI